MNKLRQIAIATSLALPFVAVAVDFPWLTFSLSDNTEMSVPSGNLFMSYKDGILLLSSDGLNESIPVENIKSMKFSTTSSGVNDILDNHNAEAEYYNLSGIKVGKFNSIDEARKALPAGIYIAKGKVKTFKVTL